MIKKLLFISCVFLTGFCSVPERHEKKLILTSVSPLADLIQKIAGDGFEVYSALQPGFSPHTFSPGAEEMKKIERAEVYFKTGLGLELENILERLAEGNKNLKSISLSKKINLIEIKSDHQEHQHGGKVNEKRQFDSHIWVSPKNALILIDEIKEQLSLIYPEKKQLFYENYEKARKLLLELDFRVAEQTQQWSKKTIVELHPAWAYFARDYGLVIAGAAQTHTGHEESTSLKEFQELIETAKKQKAAAIFIEPQLSSENAKKIAEELGLSVILVDPEGIDSRNYEEFILKNTDSMAKGLK